MVSTAGMAPVEPPRASSVAELTSTSLASSLPLLCSSNWCAKRQDAGSGARSGSRVECAYSSISAASSPQFPCGMAPACSKQGAPDASRV